MSGKVGVFSQQSGSFLFLLLVEFRQTINWIWVEKRTVKRWSFLNVLPVFAGFGAGEAKK
ncbi:hypothetical protein RJ45_25630 [Photobacterium gaetbulicola]|uniref:Uncharacterized protein n=1 Tax=Photobacterium gaetbulicola TaxID=1295392 RepID=A0A0B9G046_9GAMM|nr:hypothetical protein [Photobacterium gaetbulicola]KHT58205.1 hypothetical protein RJ45_25630 [Photobacterium gaetbulicola]